MPFSLTRAPFGHAPDGTPVELFTLRNNKGAEARITNYGGILVSLTAPDRRGRFEDMVLGMDTLDGYLSPAYRKSNPYFGALIGRYSNRLAGGRFALGSQEHQVSQNEGNHCLHGGHVGFDQRVWQPREVQRPFGPALELTYVSPDGEEGFPGTLTAQAIYCLTDENSLRTEFTAKTDAPTVVSLTQHSYFNLKGAGQGDILGHRLVLHALRFVPIDAQGIPLGELRSVNSSPMDFTLATAIGARLGCGDEQLKNGLGYDHQFVAEDSTPGLAPRLIARVEEPMSGRMLEVLGDPPGAQFYAGGHLDGTLAGKGGAVYGPHAGFCVEPQKHPNTPNRPGWSTATLLPGGIYRNRMAFRFSLMK